MAMKKDDPFDVFPEPHRGHHKRLRSAAQGGDPLEINRAFEDLNEAVQGRDDPEWFPPRSEQTQAALDRCRDRVEDGEGLALFEAIQICASTDSLLPRWVRRPLNEGMARFVAPHVREFGEAFCVPLNKGREPRFRSQRLTRIRRWNIFQFVIVERRKGRRLKPDIFEDAGRLYNVSSDQAEKDYYALKKLIEAPRP